MPFITRCQYCRHRALVPDGALGVSLECPSCRAWYTVVPAEDPGPAPKPTPPTVPAPAHHPEPTAESGETAAVATAVAAAVATAPPPPRPVRVGVAGMGPDPAVPEGRVHPLGLTACLAGGLGLLAASIPAAAFLTRPLSGAGLGLGLLAVFLALGGRPARQLFPVAGTVLSGLVLAVSLLAPSALGPRYEVSRQRSDYDPDAIRVIPLRVAPGSAEGLGQDGYADAGRAAVQQGFVRVQVTGATLGPLQPRDPKRKPTRQPYLAVGLRVQHLGHGPMVRFVHWGISEERTVPAAIAELGGQRLTPARLSFDELPAGVNYGSSLSPGHAVEDLLVFDPPTATGPLRLDLPAEAWGGRGVFRFLVPASMITSPSPPKSGNR